MPALKRRALIFESMFTNLFLEKPDDWPEEFTFYTSKDVDKAIEQYLKEKEENETTGIQGLQDIPNT